MCLLISILHDRNWKVKSVKFFWFIHGIPIASISLSSHSFPNSASSFHIFFHCFWHLILLNKDKHNFSMLQRPIKYFHFSSFLSHMFLRCFCFANFYFFVVWCLGLRLGFCPVFIHSLWDPLLLAKLFALRGKIREWPQATGSPS